MASNANDSPFATQSLADKALMEKRQKAQKTGHKKSRKYASKKHTHKKPSPVETANKTQQEQAQQVAPEVKVIADKDKGKENIPAVVALPSHENKSVPAAPVPAPVVPMPAAKPAPLPEIESLPGAAPNLPPLPEKKAAAPVPVPVPVPVSPAPAVPAPAVVVPAPKPAAPKPVPVPLPQAEKSTSKSAVIAVPVDKSTSMNDLPALPGTSAPAPVITPVPGNAAPVQEVKQLPSTPSLPPIPAAPSATPPSSPTPPSLPPLPGAEDKSIPLAPLPEKTSSAKPDKQVVASLTPAPAQTVSKPGTGPAPDLQIVFNEAETDIPLGMTDKLDALAQRLVKTPDARVSVIAYATGSDEISIYPKRVSLARGIAVRNYLVTNKNIDVERVTVKALGNKSESGPGNRVDLFVIK